MSGSRLIKAVSTHSMPFYLWHLSAIFIVAGVVMLGLGQELSTPWTWTWWATRPALFGACFVMLAALVAGTNRLACVISPDRERRPSLPPGHHVAAVAA